MDHSVFRSALSLSALVLFLCIESTNAEQFRYRYGMPAWEGADESRDYQGLCVNPGDPADVSPAMRDKFLNQIVELPISGHFVKEEGVKRLSEQIEYFPALRSEDVPQQFSIVLPTLLIQVAKIPLCREYLISRFSEFKYPKLKYMLAMETQRNGGMTKDIRAYKEHADATGNNIKYMCDGYGDMAQQCEASLARDRGNQ